MARLISFILPAHNEERHIAAAVSAARASGSASGDAFEVIVVDDSSTDETASLAAQAGARVVHVEYRHIAATRNAGARVAHGDVLFFVDADTLANAAAVRACLRELHRGAVGGGCVFTFDGVLPLWAKLLYPLAVILARTFKLAGGCFIFCTRDAFRATGGFPEQFFAAEELAFVKALKRVGRFAMPRPTVVTSGRKLRAYPAGAILALAWRWAIRGPTSFHSREGLDLWYGAR